MPLPLWARIDSERRLWDTVFCARHPGAGISGARRGVAIFVCHQRDAATASFAAGISRGRGQAVPVGIQGQVEAVGDAEFSIDGGEVVTYRGTADKESLGDLRVL